MEYIGFIKRDARFCPWGPTCGCSVTTVCDWVRVGGLGLGQWRQGMYLTVAVAFEHAAPARAASGKAYAQYI